MDQPVAELVSANSVCALVLDGYQIDYCREAHRTLLWSCDQRRLDPGRVVSSCDMAIRARDRRQDIDPSTLSTKQLVLTVIAHHHHYLRNTLPMLMSLAQRVAVRHCERQPVIRDLALAVEALATSLLDHISEEERNVLPACARGHGSVVRDILSASHREHQQLLESLRTLRQLAGDYLDANVVCCEHRALLAELQYLERDTLRHVELENNELFRRFHN